MSASMGQTAFRKLCVLSKYSICNGCSRVVVCYRHRNHGNDQVRFSHTCTRKPACVTQVIAASLARRRVGGPVCRNSNLAQEFKRATGERQVRNIRKIFRTDENNPLKQTIDHEGLFYRVADEDYRRLFQRGLNPEFVNRVKAFNETCFMIRRPAVEIFDCLQHLNYSHPAYKFIVYGRNGSGKSMTLAHVLHYCASDGWFIVHLPWPAFWPMYGKESAASSYNPERRDLPLEAIEWLAHFKTQNLQLLKNLKTTGRYVWSKREVTEEDAPLVDVVDHGLNRGKHACDCVGALLKEAKRHATDKRCKVLVVVDGVNGLWRESRIKAEDHSIVPTEKLSLVHHFKKIMKNDWSNGVILASVDFRANKPDEREGYTPRYLLGKEGFGLFDPFIPIHVEDYSDKEIYSCLEYYTDRQWIQSPQACTEDGRKELIFKSGHNPYLLDRAVAPW